MHWGFSFFDASVKETRPLSRWHFIHRKWPVSKRLRILLNASGSLAGWCQLLDSWPALGLHTIAPNLQTQNSIAERANFAPKACAVLCSWLCPQQRASSVATQELYRMELMLPYTIVNLPKHAESTFDSVKLHFWLTNTKNGSHCNGGSKNVFNFNIIDLIKYICQ